MGPHLFPRMPQQFWDSGFAPLLGCFVCALSVLIENPRRRGEMALYVAPRALYALLDDVKLSPGGLFKGARSRRLALAIEKVVFALSTSAVLTTAVHRPHALRGFVRSLMQVSIGPSESYLAKD